jgi:regulation of enolase protein 1 (concanavalin A-like superfamily)
MKRLSFSLVIAFTLFVAGCSENLKETNNKTVLEQPGDACSIKLPGIEFVRSLNGASKSVQTDGARLTLISGAKKDYFNDPDGKLSNNTAPVLLTKINNKKPFTFSAKVTPDFLETYDAGVLYIYVKDNLWQKFCFEQDERKKKRIVSVRTIGTSDDNNHDIVDVPSVFLKISSDTKTVGFYYSTDKQNWQLVRLYKNDYPSEIWLGLSSQSPLGKGMTNTFEECVLTENSIKDFRMGL